MLILADPRGEFPINDDWIYAGAAKLIAETGRYSIPGPGSPNLILQAYWGALLAKLFGFSFEVLRYSVAAIGCVGVLGLYALVRDNGGSPIYSTVCGLTLACSPSYFVSANSFMTDVPFIALSIFSILWLMRGIRIDLVKYITAGLLAAFLSICIRQFGICLLLAFAIAYPLRRDASVRTLCIAAVPLLITIGVQLLYQRWMIISNREPIVSYYFDGELNGVGLTRVPIAALFYSILALPWIGLLTFPTLCMTAWRLFKFGSPLASPRSWAVLFLAVMLSAVIIYRGPLVVPLLTKYMVKYGSTPQTLRDTYFLGQNLPQINTAWHVIATTAVTVGVMGAAMLIQFVVLAAQATWRAVRPESVTTAKLNFSFVLLLGASYWASLLILLIRNGAFFERYLLFFIPIISLLGLSLRAPLSGAVERWWAAVPAVLMIAVLFSFTVANTHDYFSWNRSRWTALTNLLAGQAAPSSIDGGYEFDGRYLYNPKDRAKATKAWWVVDDDYLIAFGPVSGYQTLRRYRVDRWLPIAPSEILVLRQGA